MTSSWMLRIKERKEQIYIFHSYKMAHKAHLGYLKVNTSTKYTFSTTSPMLHLA